MNKTELISIVHRRVNVGGTITHGTVETVLNNVLDVIKDEMREGGVVQLPGFGKFAAVKKAASKGRNPRTGAPINIPEGMRVKFSPGKHLAEAANS